MDVSQKVLNITFSIAAAYVVIRMALDFSTDNFNHLVIRAGQLAFIAAVYYYTTYRLKKDG